jgi:hypothetical protein
MSARASDDLESAWRVSSLAPDPYRFIGPSAENDGRASGRLWEKFYGVDFVRVARKEGCDAGAVIILST